MAHTPPISGPCRASKIRATPAEIRVLAFTGWTESFQLAHFALIEIGREVVVVHEPTPTGAVRKTRLWIVDRGQYSWIHPGNANAKWWIQHMETNAIVEMERGGQTHTYRAVPQPEAHAAVHELMRAKYGVADRWVRFLAGTDTYSGLITHGEKCTAVPIRLEVMPATPANH